MSKRLQAILIAVVLLLQAAFLIASSLQMEGKGPSTDQKEASPPPISQGH